MGKQDPVMVTAQVRLQPHYVCTSLTPYPFAAHVHYEIDKETAFTWSKEVPT